MLFEIENTYFNCDIDNGNVINIKSYNKKYNITYNSENINTILKNVYTENDFIIIDKNVYHLYNYLLELNNIDTTKYYLFDAIEENKSITSVLAIVDILYNLKFTKKNKIIVIGGGITQDVCGFVCAIYKRGIKWTYLPTTLLSMTDSCIGSKVNINYNTKNLLGFFMAPDQIIISDTFIKTLNHDDIVSGISEAMKISLIGGKNCYELFIQNMNTNNHFIEIIKLALNVKKTIIEYDELEKNERRALNYGHTFGHAIEISSNYFIPHGIAVLYGMIMINELFYSDKYSDINKYMYNLVPDKFKNMKMSYSTFIDCILNDKKNDGDNICFILLEDIGKIKFVYRKLEDINENLKLLFDKYFGEGIKE
jgi:3-dehydroquinate synthase